MSLAELEAELARKRADGSLTAMESFLCDKLAFKDHAIAEKEQKLSEANVEIERLWTELDRFLRVPSEEAPAAPPPPPPPVAAAEPVAAPSPREVEAARQRQVEQQRLLQAQKQAEIEREAELAAEQDMLAYMNTCVKSAIPAKPSIYGIKSSS